MRVSSVIFLPSSGTFKSQRMSTLREKRGEGKGKSEGIRAAGVRRVRNPQNIKNSLASARTHAGFDCTSPEFQQGLPAELIVILFVAQGRDYESEKHHTFLPLRKPSGRSFTDFLASAMVMTLGAELHSLKV